MDCCNAIPATAAGILLYTACGRVLAGYTPKLGKWSGFGGKIEEGESPLDAAVREVYEELFGSSKQYFLHNIANMTIRNGNYIVYPINVEHMLELQPIYSPYYHGVISSIDELCNERLAVEGQEITGVRLLSIEDVIRNEGGDIDDGFREDVMRWRAGGLDSRNVKKV